MAFDLQLVKFQEPEVVETNGSRFYLYDGERRPSITTILSQTSDKSWIDSWKSRVGEEKAEKEIKKAQSKGTSLHKLMEEYIYGNEIPKASFAVQQIFNSIRPVVSKRITTIYGVELPVYSPSLGIAGRTDLICDFDCEASIVDWKNQKDPFPKKKEYVKDYLIQSTFYGTAFNETQDQIKVTQGVLVFGNPFSCSVMKFPIHENLEELKERVDMYFAKAEIEHA